MELKEIDDLFQRLLEQQLREDTTEGLLLALALRGSGMQIAYSLAAVAQNLSEMRDEMLNQRLTRGESSA